MNTFAPAEAVSACIDTRRKAASNTNASNVIDLTLLPTPRTRKSTRAIPRANSRASCASLEHEASASTTIAPLGSPKPILVSTASTTSPSSSITPLPSILNPELTSLSPHAFTLLRTKQRLLRTNAMPNAVARAYNTAIQATLVFAQESAGTAVCISPRGLLLTCAHCIAQDEDEFATLAAKAKGTKKGGGRRGGGGIYLLFASGQIVRAECVAWDPRRDLALLQIVAAQQPLITPASTTTPAASPYLWSFPYLELSPTPPAPNAPLLCIGHPGSEDLEASLPNQKTHYPILFVSEGCFRGLYPGQDVQDNSEIGALRHDCWTYWGHSGAPLIEQRKRATGKGRREVMDGGGEQGGKLVGLHSSWDEKTGMRRGVGWEAVRGFLDENTIVVIED